MKEHINTLYTNDNLYILNGLNSESVDLIYLDPPFNSKRIYSAPIGSKSAGASFKDMWTWHDVDEYFLDSLVEKYPDIVEFIKSVGMVHSKTMMSYVTYITQRLIVLYRVLKDSGSLYLHVDPTASHYLKIVLDSIFGKNNFRNEIIWFYPDTPGRSKKYFPKKSDTIFWYSKSDNYCFNDQNIRVPIKEESKKRYESIRVLGGKEYIGGEATNIGKIPENVWQISSLKGNSKERTGYPTQKPLALLRRIIEASSKKGDVVLDPFCGCATTCVASQQLGRKWIGIDIERKAVDVLVDRLNSDAGLFRDFIQRDDIPVRTDIESVERTKSVKEQLYKEQKGKCNACGNEMRIVDFEIDHIIPKSKGGGDYYSNYQLLCSNCNRVKGNRPMEYLKTKIENRSKITKQVMFGL